MTENERRILTLLSRERPLSKKDLASRGRMGWATVVKMVARLEEDGLLVQAGTAQRDGAGALGKNAYVYDLSSALPLAIGVDVAYDRTHLLLTNLKDEVLKSATLRTPARMQFEKFTEFVADAVRDFAGPSLRALAGVGVGMPSRLVRSDEDVFTHVGIGLHIRGELYRGADGLAGELSHMTIDPAGTLCRCGKRGCLETFINQNMLYERYRMEVRGGVGKEDAGTADENAFNAGLEDLFHAAAQGNSAARAIVSEAANHLAYGLSALMGGFLQIW
jgi:predicted NBD/HSP70 family sugar kinase